MKVLDTYKYRLRLKRWIQGKISLYVARRYFDPGKPGFFNTIELELRSICNGTCPFCAAAVQYNKRPDKSMPDALFRKIIKELGDLDYGGRIGFYVNTEPLMDDRLVEFIGHARKTCPKAVLHVMTNGKLLDNAIGEAIMDAGTDILEINHYSDTPVTAPNIDKFMREIAPHYPGKVVLNMRRLTARLNNRAGSSPNAGRLDKPLKAFCQRPFQKIIISAGGKAGLCEHDFYFDEVMGDVNISSLKDIWNSDNYHRIRKALMSGMRKISPLCAGCDYGGVGSVSDPHRKYREKKKDDLRFLDRILEKINKFAVYIAWRDDARW